MSDQPPEVVTPIDDYIVIKVKPDAMLDERMLKLLNDMAAQQIMAQYHDRPPKAILMLPSEWIITSDFTEVEAFQPAHDCEDCRAGNAKASAFLLNHPEDRLACGNLHYVEVW